MAKKRRHRRGTSGLKGLNTLGNLKHGLGRDVIPPLVAGVLTAGATLGIRAYLKPTPGETSATVFKYAPLVGTGVGLLGAIAVYYMGGASQALTSALTAVITGGALYASDRQLTGGGALPMLAGMDGYGMGAVLPEYAERGDQTGLDGIVMEKVHGLAAMGEDVNLSGTVNQTAFGTAPFGGN